MRDATLVIFLSDHSEMVGLHHMAHKGPYMFEDVYAIPCIARWPNHVEGGRSVDGLFSTVDFAATVGTLCGVAVDRGAGFDHAAAWASSDAGPRDAIFAEFYGQGGVSKEIMIGLKSIRTDRWKLNVYLSDRSELYDLENDPHELANLIDRPEHAGMRRRLGARIVEWLRQTDDPLADHTEQVIAALR